MSVGLIQSAFSACASLI